MTSSEPQHSVAATPATIPARDAERRFAARSTRLHDRLARLYGGDPRFAAFWSDLQKRLMKAAAARPDDLRQLDVLREGRPDWFLQSDRLGYSAYVDRFGATLLGLKSRIGYLSDLGVNYLHLLPFWKSRAGDDDGGFAVSDYTRVRPELGDLDDLDELAAALRASDMTLCVDLVLNHTADDHPWATAAKRGDARYRAYYHVLETAAEVSALEAHLPQIFPETAPGNFTYVDEVGGWVWTTFYPFQWDLNWANLDVFTEMIELILALANRGVDAFRLDSAAFLWKTPGGVCRSLPQCHLILQALREAVGIVAPAVLLKAEVIGPVAESAPFLGSPGSPECHLGYYAGLMAAGWAALAEERADLIKAVIAATPPPPEGAGWVTYVNCHDDIGWMTLAPQAGATMAEVAARLEPIADALAGGNRYSRGEAFQTRGGPGLHGLNGATAALVGLETATDTREQSLAIARFSLLHAIAFAAGGIPLLYMGDELGQLNDHTYRLDARKAHDGRWLHRPVFDDNAAARVGETESLPGQLRGRLRRLVEARKRLPAMGSATFPTLVKDLPDAVLGFLRSEVVCLFNVSGASATLGPPALGRGPWLDLLSGDEVTGEIIQLQPYQVLWLVRTRP